MNSERLLQFIWQFRYFNQTALHTEAGEPLQILDFGTCNTNQGPDFLEASIKIDNVVLVGNIELHILSSQWHQHRHSKDANYGNIILHVVWENDIDISDKHDKPIPTLVLQNRVAKVLLERYELLMNEHAVIACEKFLPVLSPLAWKSWQERLLVERLEIKSKRVLQLLDESNHHWEEVFWWMLASNFGIKVNAELFEQVARSISINILAKHKNQIHQLEALLLGQANLLDKKFDEAYPIMLQKEYLFLQKKYQLKTIKGRPHFLRMRPANFPTIRLAQLSMLVFNSSHLFSTVKALNDIKEVKNLFNITCNDYWHYHYRLDELSEYKPKNMGNQTVENIIINTVIPILFAYGLYNNEQEYKDKAIHWLSALVSEENSITKKWIASGVENKSAFDSQSLIHLTNMYCKERRCLNCAVGNKIIGKSN